MRSVRIKEESFCCDVHAIHVPNGSQNGWAKIDHLTALPAGLQPPHPCAQLVCGDFNTPQAESDGQIVTFGQTRKGAWRSRPTSTAPFHPDRPVDARRSDAGERAVLEGLPRE